ncbi:MAG: acylphosphatase [Capsulimonas sp.]|uniref:acylphosphatase n=1 Tax=Capsulimonas sp. TaxID=2494211 RepID=UPI003263FB2F|nr:acylphosphatase [Capsulimonas sp.]
MVKRVQAHVSGQVQGVGFRYYAVHVAKELGVVGAVRNTADGGVEANAEGEEGVLNQFVTALERGPHTAHVDSVTTAWGEPVGEYSGFTAV